jgi:FKBP-type peptidyl-prolyl cis-trans isomerase
MKYIALFTCMLLMGVSACKDKDAVTSDDLAIQDYIAKNGLIAEKTPEGVYYIINKEGNGTAANIASTVTVHYKGYTLEGDIFDSSYDRGKTASFPLTNVIKGWQIGIPKISEDGAGRLMIPSHLAYGKNPPKGSGIDKNEVLIFDIEVFEVK